MRPEYVSWLVALSFAIPVQGAYVGLHLARQIAAAPLARRRWLIAAAAIALALSIWTMHFVAMLAMRLPTPTDFLVLPTLLSFLLCVLVVGFAVVAVGTGPPGPRRITLAALFLGGGIVTMHYVGMLALVAGARVHHNSGFVAASIVIGVAAAALALWLGFGAHAPRSLLGSAVLLAAAIAAMHYTAMAGTRLVPTGAAPSQLAFSSGALAVVVSVIAFIVVGLFLLALVPDRGASGPGVVLPTMPPAAAAAVPGFASKPVTPPVPESSVEARPGPPPADPFRVVPEPAAEAMADPTARPAPYTRALPVERRGLRLTLPVERLVAVQAQAHYTQIFDGAETWFCPLTISEVEGQLDPASFVRVHRSHIVRLDRIGGMRRTGDQSELLLDTPTPHRVPVARARLRAVKERLRAGAEAVH